MVRMSSYRVPRRRARAEIRVSNSRFIATLQRAGSMSDAQAFLREMRDEMPDATHHVYAFKIGCGASVSEALSDDGEPSGTSGPPALAVLRGADIGDAALVITRYFGGTKLGTGGLVAAYTQAAKAVLAIVQTEMKVTRAGFAVTVPYRLHAPMLRLLAEHEALIEGEQFGEHVCVQYQVAVERIDSLAAAIANISAGQIAPRPCRPDSAERAKPG